MRFLVILFSAALLSGCSLHRLAKGTPRQMLEAKAVHAFVGSIGPYGHRIAAANAVYRPRLYGLNPYFGR